jgi:hypothetical protein
MNKLIKLTCAKDNDKRYMSLKQDNYVNNINIYYNKQKIFKNINDAEENLPINLDAPILYDNNIENVFEIDYDIKFFNLNERAKIIWKIKPINPVSKIFYKSDLQLIRLNDVKGIENLSDQYRVTLKINEYTHIIGKEFYQENNKVMTFENTINATDYFYFSVETKKVVMNNPEIKYDQLKLEIQ